MRISPLIPFCAAGLLLTSCNDQQEKSRAVLHQQKLDFSVDDYYKAAREGKLEPVQTFLDAGMNVDAADAQGNTALLFAAEAGHGHVVKELLWHKANPNSARTDGDTPLILAARRGDAEGIRALLEAGANPDAHNNNDLTALAEAAMVGNASAVEALAPNSRSSLDYALQLAAVKGKTDVMDSLLKNGANTLARSSENRTPLMYAAKYGHEDAVRLLIERGSNVLALDNDLKTAAMLADEGGHANVAAVLNEPRTPTNDDLKIEQLAQNMTEGAFGKVIAASSEGGEISPNAPDSATEKEPKPAPVLQKLANATVTAPAEHQSVSDLPTFLKFDSFRERQLPFVLKDVTDDGETASVQMLTAERQAVDVKAGDVIPTTDFEMIGAVHRMKAAKSGKGKLVDVSTLLVRDRNTNERILAQRNLPVTAADSFGVIHNASSGEVYEVRPGDIFQIGSERYKAVDIRPTQVLVENLATKETVILQK